MGKPSKLKQQVADNRYSHGNGDRKLYDRDRKPDGLDEDVWSLALYFEQLGEEHGCSTPGRHIVYTELYHRVSKDPDLSALLDVSSNSAYSGIAGIDILNVLEDMILMYWEDIAAINGGSYINDFCSIEKFSYIKKYVADTKERQLLLSNGIRTPLVEREIKPSRKTDVEREVAIIKNRKYTEQELADKFRRFREGK